MQRYESYKPSGVKWLGDIPENWDVCRNIGLFDERKEINQPDMELLSVTINRGVIRQEEITEKKDSSNEDKSKYKVVRKDDLAYNKMRMWQGAIGRSEYEGIVSPAYVILSPRDKLYSRYYHYLYRTEAFIAEANRHSYGLCLDMNSLRYEDFKTIYSPVPPRSEVERIVAFLDQKTAEIDAAISKKERLIELLEESLSIRITCAVTQGLNLDASLKNSGYQWLGSIPSTWRPMKLAWVCSSIRDGTHNPPPEAESEYRLLSVRNIVAGRFVIRDDDRTMTLPAFKALKRSYTVQRDDVVLALVGGTTGKSAVVDIDCENISVQRSLGILRPMTSKVLPEFLNFSLRAKGLQRRIWDIATKYAAQPGIYLEDVGNLKIAVPQIPEQALIVQHCNDVQEQIYTTIMSVTREIQSLRELKRSLVFDGVSGKIKV